MLTWEDAAERAFHVQLSTEAVPTVSTDEDRLKLLEAADKALGFATLAAREFKGVRQSEDVAFHLATVARYAKWLAASYGDTFDGAATAAFLGEKQANYGTDNIERFGGFGLCVRTSDKIARARNMIAKGRTGPDEEPLVDCFADMIGYAVIAEMLRANTFRQPLARDVRDGNYQRFDREAEVEEHRQRERAMLDREEGF